VVVHPASHQISRVRRYSRNRGTRPVLPSPTGLSPAAAARSSGVRLTRRLGRRVSRPLPAIRSSPAPAAPTGSYAGAVWAPPRSLAATEGIVSAPAGTEMFQFPACPPRLARCPGLSRAGCPIRRSRAHRLPAPPPSISPRGRVLPRPQAPRHPPCAHLRGSASVVIASRSRRRPAGCQDRHPGAPARMVDRARVEGVAGSTPHPAREPVGMTSSALHLSTYSAPSHELGATCSPLMTRHPPGGAAGTRTPDLRRAKAALSQLSYGPVRSLTLLAARYQRAAGGPALRPRIWVRRACPHRSPRPPRRIAPRLGRLAAWSVMLVGGRAWTRTRGLGLIRAAL
jgi:hypothetical protein